MNRMPLTALPLVSHRQARAPCPCRACLHIPPKCLLLTIAPVSSNVSQSKPCNEPVSLRCGFGQTNLSQACPHGYAL